MADLSGRGAGIQRFPRVRVDSAFHLRANRQGELQQLPALLVQRSRFVSEGGEPVIRLPLPGIAPPECFVNTWQLCHGTHLLDWLEREQARKRASPLQNSRTQ